MVYRRVFRRSLQLGLRQDVEVNTWTDEVKAIGQPTFYLNVVQEGGVEPDGRFNVAYNTLLGRNLVPATGRR